MSTTKLITFKGENAKFKFEIGVNGYLHMILNDMLIDTFTSLGKVKTKLEMECAIKVIVNQLGGEIV
jgi:hypothetical protein